MSVVESPVNLLEEVASFLATNPSRDELLEFKPSAAARQRAHELLELMRNDELTEQDEKELEQFQNVELLMRLLKAKLRAESGA
ncbi:MAG: hypothetical protein WD066_05195 [Planctomycetaceae bacterium]